ncbi:hypothetical protein OAG76_05420, partial [Rubripirellula sp.]|nr:hypothetical protein [Rubripirellula sp.]
MRHTRSNYNRRRFLRSTALLGVVSTFLPRTLIKGEKPLTKGLPVRRDALGNPALPANWKDGPQALETAEYNPHGRSIPTKRQICCRKTAGWPGLGY